MPRTFVFDAYGTLFDAHAAIGRYQAAAGPDADRFSEFWRTKQLEYSWTLTLAGRYLDFWTLTERARDLARSQSAWRRHRDSVERLAKNARRRRRGGRHRQTPRCRSLGRRDPPL